MGPSPRATLPSVAKPHAGLVIRNMPQPVCPQILFQEELEGPGDGCSFRLHGVQMSCGLTAFSWDLGC